jgi:pimeloyl-ACP methyl ester carboxylesterase
VLAVTVNQSRYNIPELAKKYKVYAIDLLGFGWSEKALVDYEATIWMEQVSDFLREIVKEPAVLVGNRYATIS